MVYFADAVYKNGVIDWLMCGRGEESDHFSSSTEDPNISRHINTSKGLEWIDSQWLGLNGDSVSIKEFAMYDSLDKAQRKMIDLIFQKEEK